ncbi:hypothetical protein L484_009905 [Morus notabilis]|uniref:BHLH domain-containing protein n=1 Tax=Morus notabilis TaxID=981085 RepID=W9RZG0_9ROSA|nr:transcription factor bHLH51 [Morus notabilis]EXC04712.1 hypothetical protein L484_009905 [Morus notabilis]
MENFCHQYSSPNQPKEANFSESSLLVPWHIPSHQYVSTSTAFQFCGLPSLSLPIDNHAEDKAMAASKSHSQAEKRRRDRINAQLATLRKLIPKSDKMDKAALLGSVIDQVKDLKRKAVEVGKSLIVPTEVDEIIIESDLSDEDVNVMNLTNKKSSKSDNNIYIRASVCCDDRPELFSELIQVLKGLRLTPVRADVASIGGRIKSVLILCSKDHAQEAVSINTLKQSLKLVLSKIASESMASNCRIRSKRQRFFLPSCNQ